MFRDVERVTIICIFDWKKKKWILYLIVSTIRRNYRGIKKREGRRKRESDFLRENLHQEFWTFCTYERRWVLMAAQRAKRDNKEALTMSAMCSVEWRRTRARKPFSPSLRDEETSTREYVGRTSNEHRPRTSYEEAARSRTVFCHGCNWACLVELPFKWITRRRARHESSLRNRSDFFRKSWRFESIANDASFFRYIPYHFFLSSFFFHWKKIRDSREC